jgi:hypothetical protein
VGARPRRAGLDLSWGASEGLLTRRFGGGLLTRRFGGVFEGLLTQGNVILKGGAVSGFPVR